MKGSSRLAAAILLLFLFSSPALGIGSGSGVATQPTAACIPTVGCASIIEGKLFLTVHKSSSRTNLIFSREPTADYTAFSLNPAGEFVEVIPLTSGSEADAHISSSRLASTASPSTRGRARAIYGYDDVGYTIDVTDFLLTTIGDDYYQVRGINLEASRGSINPAVLKILSVVSVGGILVVDGTTNVGGKGSTDSYLANFRFSISQAPLRPMVRRSFDPRMGFWRERFLQSDYSPPARGFITRWRIERPATRSLGSESIRPIVFYLDPAIPTEWRDWVKRGVESWNVAFRAAGLGNVVRAVDPPEDADWPMFSAAHSSVIWIDGGKGADGGSAGYLVDERSGEILKAHIKIKAPYKYLHEEYYVRCGPLDSRAAAGGSNIRLMGELIEQLIAHETGHALGLRDGNYGEFAVEVGEIRDRGYLSLNSFSPSVMSYSRCNNVAQPEDLVPPTLLHQRVGVADIAQIEWGYTMFPAQLSVDKVQARLDALAKRIDSDPKLRFIMPQSEVFGPQVFDGVVDSKDPISVARLSIRNLKRMLGALESAAQSGLEPEKTKSLYKKGILQWSLQLKYVNTLVGGRIRGPAVDRNTSPTYTNVPYKAQLAAVDLLGAEAFGDVSWLVRPALHAEDALSMVSASQNDVLADLLSPGRIQRMAQSASAPGQSDLAVTELLSQITSFVWAEYHLGAHSVAPLRRTLQYNHLVWLKFLCEDESTGLTLQDRRAIGSEIDEILSIIVSAISSITDQATQSHVERLLEIGNLKICS